MSAAPAASTSPAEGLERDPLGDGGQEVRVEIGRVEVRSAAPPPPAPRPAAAVAARPGPNLSLASYLKRRGGDGVE
ncbi:MAG: hypothetical protein AAGD01_16100 [Acidobacteriota bacterium]